MAKSMDIVSYIKIINQKYGSDPKPGWQHAPWQDYPQDDDIP